MVDRFTCDGFAGCEDDHVIESVCDNCEEGSKTGYYQDTCKYENPYDCPKVQKALLVENSSMGADE